VPNSEIEQSATLIILGADLDPGEVTKKMGLQPWQSWRKGDRKSYIRRDGTRREFNSVYEWGGWKLPVPQDQENQEIIGQLRYWAETLRSRTASLQYLRDRGSTIELNCCLVGDDTIVIRIPADVQKDLANLCVDLDITFYAHGPHDGAV
jgi:hypothetical protein